MTHGTPAHTSGGTAGLSKLYGTTDIPIIFITKKTQAELHWKMIMKNQNLHEVK